MTGIKSETVVEQRKARRFNLKLPLELIRSGSKRLGEKCETRNVSSRGVLFRTGTQAMPGQRVEYVITLAHQQNATVSLRCIGKVVRRTGEGEIAASLDRYQFIRN